MQKRKKYLCLLILNNKKFILKNIIRVKSNTIQKYLDINDTNSFKFVFLNSIFLKLVFCPVLFLFV